MSFITNLHGLVFDRRWRPTRGRNDNSQKATKGAFLVRYVQPADLWTADDDVSDNTVTDELEV